MPACYSYGVLLIYPEKRKGFGRRLAIGWRGIRLAEPQAALS